MLVKHAWGKYVSVLDLSQYNMVWLKIELYFRVRNTLSCVVRMYAHMTHPITGKRMWLSLLAFI